MVELADFAEKNAKRIRILKATGLADFTEKNAKRMEILKKREFECCCLTERLELIVISLSLMFRS